MQQAIEVEEVGPPVGPGAGFHGGSLAEEEGDEHGGDGEQVEGVEAQGAFPEEAGEVAQVVGAARHGPGEDEAADDEEAIDAEVAVGGEPLEGLVGGEALVEAAVLGEVEEGNPEGRQAAQGVEDRQARVWGGRGGGHGGQDGEVPGLAKGASAGRGAENFAARERLFSCPMGGERHFGLFMATIIEMPKLSDTMVEGTLVRWLKKEGDKVANGDVLAEIETDKATMEMAAFDEGILGKIYVAAGSKAPLGAALGVIVDEGEALPAAPVAGASVVAAAASAAPAAAAASSAGSRAAAVRTSSVAAANGKVKASPLARRVAAERGTDLRRLVGSGPGGRIVRADVEAAPVEGSGGAAKGVAVIRPVMGAEDRRVPLSGMRTIIAERLYASKTQIPHFYLNIEVDAGPILALRAQINAGSEKTGGNKYTVNDFILKAVAGAAAQVPAVNASFDGDSIVQFAKVNLSVAIAVEDGLVTPVIRDAARKSMLELSTEVKDLAAKAKSKKLSPDAFAGGTLTVSNLGAYGIDNFDAIINPPQAAILSIGAAKKMAVVNAKGEIVVGDRMWVGMSCDHRVVDGAVGATYLGVLKKLLENPALMLV